MKVSQTGQTRGFKLFNRSEPRIGFFKGIEVSLVKHSEYNMLLHLQRWQFDPVFTEGLYFPFVPAIPAEYVPQPRVIEIEEKEELEQEVIPYPRLG
jgi:hypothetical protein